jgi:hypothetical protein
VLTVDVEMMSLDTNVGTIAMNTDFDPMNECGQYDARHRDTRRIRYAKQLADDHGNGGAMS